MGESTAWVGGQGYFRDKGESILSRLWVIAYNKIDGAVLNPKRRTGWKPSTVEDGRWAKGGTVHSGGGASSSSAGRGLAQTVAGDHAGSRMMR